VVAGLSAEFNIALDKFLVHETTWHRNVLPRPPLLTMMSQSVWPCEAQWHARQPRRAILWPPNPQAAPSYSFHVIPEGFFMLVEPVGQITMLPTETHLK